MGTGRLESLETGRLELLEADRSLKADIRGIRSSGLSSSGLISIRQTSESVTIGCVSRTTLASVCISGTPLPNVEGGLC